MTDTHKLKEETFNLLLVSIHDRLTLSSNITVGRPGQEKLLSSWMLGSKAEENARDE